MEQHLKKSYEIISDQIEYLENTLNEIKVKGELLVEYKQKLKELKKLKKELKKIYGL
jgi:prefoldin subunit 5